MTDLYRISHYNLLTGNCYQVVMADGSLYRSILKWITNWESSIIKMRICEICLNTEIKQRPESALDVFQCSKCGHLMFVQELRDSTNDGEEFCRFIEAQNQTFEQKRIDNTANILIDLIEIKEDERVRIFDIGCGSGEFLSMAKRLDLEVYGCEISLEAVNFCKSKNLENVSYGKFEDLEILETFHAITMFCVLAHVVDFRILLTSIKKHLTPDGIMYLHTPAYCNIDYLALKGVRLGLPLFERVLRRRVNREHKRIFTEDSLRKLLANYEFEIIDIRRGVGFGLRKRFYFQQIGFPDWISVLLEKTSDFLESLNLLPKNVLYVYAKNKSHQQL
jgi:2-polyprenyl-3-methyl-5-hydroxy-6-metoxy-1,4-benzoquinol methylase